MLNGISRMAVFIVFAGVGGVFVKYKVVHRATGQGSAGYKTALYLMFREIRYELKADGTMHPDRIHNCQET